MSDDANANSDPKRSDDESPPSGAEQQISGQLFAVSSGLVGVCLTVIGVLNAFRRPGVDIGIGDNLIAVDAIVFLLACLSSYLALRARRRARWQTLERWAHTLFLIGLAGMVLISGLIAYELV